MPERERKGEEWMSVVGKREEEEGNPKTRR